MKKLIKYAYLTLITGALLTSCSEEDHTGASEMSYSSTAITLTSAQAAYTIDESLIDEDTPSTFTITINASIAQPQPVDATVSFVQSDGTADSSDYSVGEIKIPAGTTSGSTKVEINRTGDIEGTENFSLSAKAGSNFTLASSFNLAVTIENDHVNDILETATTWSGETSFDDASGAVVTLDFCNIDLDVLLFTDAGDFVKYLGATGACTETGSISGLPDGDYFIVLDLYDNPYSSFGVTEALPVTVSYSQDNFASDSFIYDGLTVSSPEGLTAVAVITISGYNYTVTPL